MIVVVQERGLMRKPRRKFTFEGQGKNRDRQKKKITRASETGQQEPGVHQVMEGKGHGVDF